jgi:hypothetical protein
MVVANRLAGELDSQAMPFLHRYLGTPAISRFLRLVTRVPVKDSQSGYRAFWKDRMEGLRMRATGMEYASEMLLRAGRAGLRVEEIPSTYRERVGDSKLNTFADGWRHLKLLLVMNPHLTLIIPALLLLAAGAALSVVSAVAPMGVPVGNLRWLPVFAGPMLLIIGAQALFLGSLAAHRSDLTPSRVRSAISFLDNRGAVEMVLARFLLVLLAGVTLDAALFALWLANASGPELLGLAGVAQALVVIGVNGLVTVMSAEFTQRSFEA